MRLKGPHQAVCYSMNRVMHLFAVGRQSFLLPCRGTLIILINAVKKIQGKPPDRFLPAYIRPPQTAAGYPAYMLLGAKKDDGGACLFRCYSRHNSGRSATIYNNVIMVRTFLSVRLTACKKK